MSYILQFINNAKFMANSLSNLGKKFFEEIHRIKCKYGHDDKKVRHVELSISTEIVFLNI